MQVKKHRMLELVARKLSGINGVPNAERDRMVQRCAKAAAAEYEQQQRRIAELEVALVDLIGWASLDMVELQREGHTVSHLAAAIDRAQKAVDAAEGADHE